MKNEKKVNAIYIHIPFCKTICSYCDFCKLYYHKEWVELYLNELENEIDNIYRNETANTIYIGGGTPNSLSTRELTKLFKIINKIKKSTDLEFTIECNLELLTEEQLILFKKNRINRISIGIETTNEKQLTFLNRKYNKKEIKEKINLVKKYFDNINVDLIYALPNQTLKDLEEDLDFILSLNVNHISTYSLMIEPNTVLYVKKQQPIEEDLDYKMYQLIIKKLKEYEHYEISNFSKKGFNSKHNLVYWNNKRYYGFGLGASGYIDNIRYDNTKSLNNYLKGNYVLNKEIIDINIEKEYELILGFRKINGINLRDYKKKYNENLLENEIIKKLIKNNKLQLDDENLKINKEFIYVENDILVSLIGG